MKEDYLSNELKELYSFVRSDILAYITWFTVFTTVNFAVIGYLLSYNNMSQYAIIIYIISIFMSFQNVFAIFGSIKMKRRLEFLSKKAILIGEKIDTQQTQLVGILLSDEYYGKIYNALIAGLIPLLMFWVACPFIII